MSPSILIAVTFSEATSFSLLVFEIMEFDFAQGLSFFAVVVDDDAAVAVADVADDDEVSSLLPPTLLELLETESVFVHALFPDSICIIAFELSLFVAIFLETCAGVVNCGIFLDDPLSKVEEEGAEEGRPQAPPLGAGGKEGRTPGAAKVLLLGFGGGSFLPLVCLSPARLEWFPCSLLSTASDDDTGESSGRG